MYSIVFFRDRKGNEPVADYIRELDARNDKEARIKLCKIRSYIKVLMKNGTYAGKPFVKHIDGDIWELRPLQDRIFFAAWVNESFVLLHHFVKKSRKTPASEIRRAKAELSLFLEEHGYER
ncbi:MAG: type II toxin-antitoxin system RelE/ParE family toxin [Spirochaetales bacterium]|nr:type II toxin-antitoxin system RelE/ParE family toxin [Spirochaetales bacterium]